MKHEIAERLAKIRAEHKADVDRAVVDPVFCTKVMTSPEYRNAHSSRAYLLAHIASLEVEAETTVEPYGKELILDLSNCNVDTFTRKSIGLYFSRLCELIDMQAEDRYFWDDEGVSPELCQTNPKTCGISAVQFILTSTIVLHSLTKLGKVYVNIFSCKDFDSDEARDFTIKWFGARTHSDLTVVRK